MRIGIIALTFLALLFAGTVGQGMQPPSGIVYFPQIIFPPPLSQHTMAKYVGSDGMPVPEGGNYAFSVCDEQAVSWLFLWRDKQMHWVEWRWYSPLKGRVYARTFGVIPPDYGPMGIWSAPIWSCLKICGNDPEYMPGLWKVDVIVDYRKVLTEYFTIDGTKSCKRLE
jgi:hypothetical protein